MSACEDLVHTGAAYFAIEYHRDSAVVLMVPAFVSQFWVSYFHLGALYVLFVAQRSV